MQLTGNKNKEVLEMSIAPIDASILELERKLHNVKDTYKSVTLEWDVELEDKLSLTGQNNGSKILLIKNRIIFNILV